MIELPRMYHLRCQHNNGTWAKLAFCYGINQSSDTAIHLDIWSPLSEAQLINWLTQMRRCALLDLLDREVATFNAEFLGLSTIQNATNPFPQLGGTWTTASWQVPATSAATSSVH